MRSQGYDVSVSIVTMKAAVSPRPAILTAAHVLIAHLSKRTGRIGWKRHYPLPALCSSLPGIEGRRLLHAGERRSVERCRWDYETPDRLLGKAHETFSRYSLVASRTDQLLQTKKISMRSERQMTRSRGQVK